MFRVKEILNQKPDLGPQFQREQRREKERKGKEAPVQALSCVRLSWVWWAGQELSLASLFHHEEAESGGKGRLLSPGERAAGWRQV